MSQLLENDLIIWIIRSAGLIILGVFGIRLAQICRLYWEQNIYVVRELIGCIGIGVLAASILMWAAGQWSIFGMILANIGFAVLVIFFFYAGQLMKEARVYRSVTKSRFLPALVGCGTGLGIMALALHI